MIKASIVLFRADRSNYEYVRKGANSNLGNALRGTLNPDGPNGRTTIIAAGMAYDKTIFDGLILKETC